jgi:hypothetical protein
LRRTLSHWVTIPSSNTYTFKQTDLALGKQNHAKFQS